MTADSGMRQRILGLLRDGGAELTVAEIAERLEVHPNTVRFHLDVLLGRGQVERVPVVPSGRGRPPMRVRAIVGMDPGGPRHYRMLAEALVVGLAEADAPGTRASPAERAGRAWGGRLVAAEEPDAAADPLAALTRILRELDFAPEPDGPERIALRSCPFLELTRSTRDVVCAVHLGLMRGVLDALDSEVGVARLEPFVRPDRCMTYLTRPALSA